MRYWDSSAVLPLLVAEPATSAIRELLREDSSIVVWWATRVECVSALRRREREGAARNEVDYSLGRLYELSGSWTEVLPVPRVLALAERALAVHALRAADALQLAAALAWCADEPAGASLVSLDGRLRDAARREGFSVRPADSA